MEVSERLRVLSVQYGGGNITITVQKQLVTEEAVHNVDFATQLTATEAHATELADGKEWGNAEVEALIREHKIVDAPPILASPALREVLDSDGVTVVRAATDAFPGRDATYKFAYPKIPIVWE